MGSYAPASVNSHPETGRQEAAAARSSRRQLDAIASFASVL